MRPIQVTYSDVSGGQAPLPLDIYVPSARVSVQVDVTGTIDYTVQYTNDNIWDPNATIVWHSFPVVALVGATADQIGIADGPFRALRLLVNSGDGAARMTIVQQSTQ